VTAAPTVLLPDAEALVIEALLTLPDLAPFGGRIYSAVPKARTFPLARIFRYGGDPWYEGHPYWIDAPSLQGDVWADGRPLAQSLAETLRACCAQHLPGIWPLGTILSTKVSALVNSDDLTFDPPKNRFRFTLTMIDHP
jgi:hypothetical protein